MYVMYVSIYFACVYVCMYVLRWPLSPRWLQLEIAGRLAAIGDFAIDLKHGFRLMCAWWKFNESMTRNAFRFIDFIGSKTPAKPCISPTRIGHYLYLKERRLMCHSYVFRVVSSLFISVFVQQVNKVSYR